MSRTPKIPARKRKWADHELAAWAEKHPIGTKVRFWPMRGDVRFEDAEIASAPWRLGHGDPIVRITRHAGGVALDHLCRIEAS